MESVVILGLLGIGYLFNEENKKNKENIDINTNIPLNNDKYYNNDVSHHEKYNKILNMSNQPNNCKDTSLHIMNSSVTKNKNNNLLYSETLDSYIKKDDFLKNDQGIGLTPYFKGRSAAIIDLNDNNKFEAHQGGYAAVHKQKKIETPLLFEPTKQEVFGNRFEGPISDKERYVNSKLRTNELPFQKEYIQPIDSKSLLNREIDYEIAKKNSVDSLRTLNNPKVSYEGRVIRGNGIYKGELMGDVKKYRPDGFYKNSPARNLISVASVQAETQRPVEIIKNTNRQSLNKGVIGHVAPINGISGHENRINMKITSKQQFKPDTVRNGFINSGNYDYENYGYNLPSNEREVTLEKNHYTNVYNTIPNKTLGIQDKIKNTMKETTLDLNRNGIVGTSLHEHTTHLQDNVRNTMKETTIDLNRNGIAGTTISENIYREGDLNTRVNPTKEILSKGREPTICKESLTIGSKDLNYNFKKLENDYMTRDTKGQNKVYQTHLDHNSLDYTKEKNQLKDTDLLLERINPDLLTPFKENPYTKPLSSHAY